MARVKFSREFLIEELGLPSNAIEDEVVYNTRWSIVHSIIFSLDGKFYETEYSVGATEIQDESPWEYESEVECDEVYKVQKMVDVWETV